MFNFPDPKNKDLKSKYSRQCKTWSYHDITDDPKWPEVPLLRWTVFVARGSFLPGRFWFGSSRSMLARRRTSRRRSSSKTWIGACGSVPDGPSARSRLSWHQRRRRVLQVSGNQLVRLPMANPVRRYVVKQKCTILRGTGVFFEKNVPGLSRGVLSGGPLVVGWGFHSPLEGPGI